ncbi:MAG: RNA methyltransferase [Hyphomicrobiaceae bacterium]
MRKVRRETGLFLAEGASIVMTARENGWVPATVVLGPASAESAVARDIHAWARARGADCLDVSGAVLEKLAAKDNPQSVMAVFPQRWADPPATAKLPATALWLALEGIRDPGNLGTIIRTLDACGADGVILVGDTCDPYSREAVRASMGSIFAVPVARMSRSDFLALAKAWPGDVVGTHLRGSIDYRTAGYASRCLLVMGTEGAGMTGEAVDVCRKLVRIPMAGKLDSLNLAVATALVLYEIKRPSLEL